MFEDSGKRLQNWAKILFVFAVIAFIILGIIELVSIVKVGYQVSKSIFILLLTIIVEIVAAWIGALGMTALGQVHEKMEGMENTLQEMRKTLSTQDRSEQKLDRILESIPQTIGDGQKDNAGSSESVICPACQASNNRSARYCDKCGTYLIGKDAQKPSEPVSQEQAEPIPQRQIDRVAPQLNPIARQEQSEEVLQKPSASVVRNKVCPKCRRENPAEYFFCKYCGERLN